MKPILILFNEQFLMKQNCASTALLYTSNLATCELFLFSVVGFRNLIEEESTYWTLVNSLNLQNELMDVHQSDISKMLQFSTSNLVSFIFIKSRHFTEAYLVLLHKTSHTSCFLFFFWFPHENSFQEEEIWGCRGWD